MLEGAQIGGYRVVKQIGAGGMGAVWLAEHSALGRRAALKVLHAEYSSRADVVQRFFNEARAATAISDPGIVQIFDFGHHTDGSAYIVMELLDGEPLDRRLARSGALDVADALRIMRQVASTLGAAHSRGIIHRDLKPENIFMVRDPEVAGGERAKILDFGIAKLIGDPSGSKTQTSAVMGTPTYMSPEQCRGAGHVDQRSDVYALGCVLFMLIVGRPPFDAAGVGEIIAMHLREPAVAPSTMRPGIAAEIDELVLQCLAKDPADRPGSAAELAQAIGALLQSSASPSAARSPLGATMSTGAPIFAKVTTLSAAAGASANIAKPRPNRARAVIAGVASVTVVAVILIVALRRGDETTGAQRLGSAGADEISDATVVVAETVAPVAPVVPVDASPPSPAALASPSILAALERFAEWSKANAAAPCPDAATLGVVENDAWGHPLQITCTDQPGSQMAGAVSSGPDGVFGTADDIASWELGPEITRVVRGARWPAALATKTATKKKPSSETRVRPTQTQPQTETPKASSLQVDELGLPISR
ncbi:MAG TPA: serine/threonine-protein kinase [Kofleriaceae bacterium]|nr:serine/threonine-protein kinase [Kofleriaceae bacterium]